MPHRKTRSSKDKDLVSFSNKELAHLERTNRKAKIQKDMVNPLVLVQGEGGQLFDLEGNRRNAQGQKLDANGVVIQEEIELHQPNEEGDLQAARTLADYNRPDQFYANRSAIRPPPFERQDFHIPVQYYTLMGQHQFHGLPNEHPMDHIEKVEHIVDGLKANGVSRDYLFCTLFPFSLAGEASTWLKQLAPGSLTTWEGTKNEFLNHFYDDSRSEELRNKISTFTQGPRESFKSCWLRFQSYQRDCPHHGFTEAQLLSTFFRGVDWMSQMSLNSASNGNFMTNSPQNALVLIKNLASSNSAKMSDFERQKQASSLESCQIAEVQAKLDSLHSMLAGKSKDEDVDVNYVGGGFQNQRFQHGQGTGYSRNYGNSSYQPPPQKSLESSKLEAMMERILEGQQKLEVTFNGKLDSVYTDLNGKIEQMNIHMRKLDVQVAQTAESVRRQEGFLPGKTDANPKQYVNAISMESAGEELALLEYDDEVAVLYHDSTCVDRHRDVHRSTQHQCRSTQGGATIDAAGAPIDTDLSVDRHTTRDLDNSVHDEPIRSDSNPKTISVNPQSQKAAENVPERVYKPRVPYPKPPRTSSVPVPPVVHHAKAKVPEAEAKPAQPALRTLKKMINPGRFVISCSINGKVVKNSLCDTGANVNVMTQAVAKKLGITDSQPPKNSVEGIGAIKLTPTGFVPNLMLRVGDCLVPTDFHIVEAGDDCKTPIVLGSSFLTTAGAIVDCLNQRISFSNVDRNVFYPFVPDSVTFCKSVILGEPLHLKPEPVIVKLQSNPKEKPKRTSSPFAKVSIRIPLELQDKGEEAIRQELRRTMELFPKVQTWELQGGLLVAKGKHHGRSKAKLSQDEGGKEPLKDPPDA